MEFNHVSVLLKESLEQLITDKNGIYVDCTLGGAGHALAIGEKLSNKGMIVGLDQDEMALQVAAKRLSQLKCSVVTVKSNFKDLKNALYKEGIYEVDGFIFDLGVSSYQLDTPERGFSYMHDGPLDMRMDISAKYSAKELVNSASADELIRIIKEYGEERWAKRIVEFIVEARKYKVIDRTQELVDIIKKAIPAKARREGPHPAKRTFQALRIAVNDELMILEKSYKDAFEILRPGGRICVITFHSLEDRITKKVFKEFTQGCVCPPELPFCVCNHKAVGKGKNKAIEPSEVEVGINPRSRSARLRVIEKL